MPENDDPDEIHCRRCDEGMHVREDEWFRHSISREPPRAEIEQKLDEGLEFDDYFSESVVLCPGCEDDYREFLGESDS